MAVDPALLLQFKLYRGLAPETRSALAQVAHLKKLRKGQRLWRQGESSSGYYSTLSGLVKSFRETPEGREQVLCLLTPGQQVGTMSVLSDTPYPCHVTVLEGGEALYFPKAAFKEVVAQHHDLALHLLANLASQCNVLANRIEDLSLRDAEERLGHYLLQLPVKGTDEAGDSWVRLPVSKTTLASILGMSRETLSRTFALLQNRKLIHVNGREITLLDLDGLEAAENHRSKEIFTH